MEGDKRPPKMNGLRNPLNVVAEKIEETRARVHGDGSTSLKDFLVSSRTVVSAGGTSGEVEETVRPIGETGEDEDFDDGSEIGSHGSDANAVPKMSKNDVISNCTSDESDTALSGLSEDEKWARNIFKIPLIHAMRDILTKRPTDPVNYLAEWLLNYRSLQERSQLLDERDRELAEERKRIQESYSELLAKSEVLKDIGSYVETFEEDEQIGDTNFQDYEIS